MSGGESRVLTSSGDIGQFLLRSDGESLVFVQPRPRPVVFSEADPNGARQPSWWRETSGRVRRFTGPEFVGEEELADAPVDRQLVRFDLATQTSLVLTPDVGDYADLDSCPANKRWCARVASIRNQIRPSAESWAVEGSFDGSGPALLLQRPGTILSSPRPSGDGNLPSPSGHSNSPTPQ